MEIDHTAPFRCGSQNTFLPLVVNLRLTNRTLANIASNNSLSIRISILQRKALNTMLESYLSTTLTMNAIDGCVGGQRHLMEQAQDGLDVGLEQAMNNYDEHIAPVRRGSVNPPHHHFGKPKRHSLPLCYSGK